jgi:hypothetical protein
MSTTTVSEGLSAAGVRPLVAPRKVRRASSSPEIVRASIPKRSFSSSRKAGPFEASRMALVATAIVSVTPSRSITSRYLVSASRTRSMASCAS